MAGCLVRVVLELELEVEVEVEVASDGATITRATGTRAQAWARAWVPHLVMVLPRGGGEVTTHTGRLQRE